MRTKRIAMEFRNDAVECLRLASQVTRHEHKALLLNLARAWICVAEQAAQRTPSDHPGISPSAAPRAKWAQHAWDREEYAPSEFEIQEARSTREPQSPFSAGGSTRRGPQPQRMPSEESRRLGVVRRRFDERMGHAPRPFGIAYDILRDKCTFAKAALVRLAALVGA